MRKHLMTLALAGLTLTSCGRSLSDGETALASDLFGETLQTERVRFVPDAPLASVTFERKARPRVTCRERILPPSKEETVTATPAALSLFNKVYFSSDWFAVDYQALYPDKINIVATMLFAHELTHVWQWQNRKLTGYHPLRAAAEHSQSDDPYLFDLDEKPDFLDFGYEQQGAIVEEYVCCRALAPQAPRTKRLHDMLGKYLQLSELPNTRQSDVVLPWDGVQVSGICS